MPENAPDGEEEREKMTTARRYFVAMYDHYKRMMADPGCAPEVRKLARDLMHQNRRYWVRARKG